MIGAPSDFRSKTAPRKKKDSNWLLWLSGGIVGLFLIVIIGSILTFNLLRRNENVTATPVIFAPQPGQPTETLLPEQITPTIIPTETAAPDVILPEPTITITPWPTNTVRP